MKVGLIGLGRMGISIVDRLVKAGHDVVGFDPSADARIQAEKLGATVVESIEQITAGTRIFWLMVPAGKPVDEVIDELRPGLKAGDIVIDGGNSHFPDSVRRYAQLQQLKVHFVDCGVSGGLKGREIGFSIMVGGDKQIFEHLIPIFEALSAPDGFGYMGPAGAGHYVKMIHNGVEYALLQAYAEGFHLLQEGRYNNLDLEKIARVWSNGSVIRSWIVELCEEIFNENPNLTDVPGAIGENLPGRLTQQEAHEQRVPIRMIDDSLDIREWSRETGGNFGTKVVAMLRNKFGGHKLEKKSK